jgi:hypothetical protein
MTATTWHGRRGTVLLGPTEHRVARWLADMTRSGRITIRTVDLAAATHVERSEAYRITARLRILGLFGVENDRGGTRGGRRYWRTAIEHDGAGLDAVRHRAAWSRVRAWAAARVTAAAAHLASLRSDRASSPPGVTAHPAPASPPARLPEAGVGSFLDRLRRNGLAPELADEFGR